MSEEVEAPNAGNWDEDFADKPKAEDDPNRRKAEYMDTSEPGSYRVRLAGQHVKFRKHWKPFRATVKDDGKATDPAWQAGFVPGKRFAINVIDKTGVAEGETGTLKILEKGAQVFKNFANYKTATGKDPASKEGPDFIITVTVPMVNGQPNKMKTEYSVIPVEPTPFTEAEKAMIKEVGLFPLKEIYRPATAEKLQELWDELPADKKIAPEKPWEKEKREAAEDAGTTKAEAPKEPTTSKDEELFEKKDDAGDDSADLF